jgi:hypothetical protein
MTEYREGDSEQLLPHQMENQSDEQDGNVSELKQPTEKTDEIENKEQKKDDSTIAISNKKVTTAFMLIQFEDGSIDVVDNFGMEMDHKANQFEMKVICDTFVDNMRIGMIARSCAMEMNNIFVRAAEQQMKMKIAGNMKKGGPNFIRGRR